MGESSSRHSVTSRSQLTPAKLKRLYRMMQHSRFDPKLSAVYAAVALGCRAGDRWMTTQASRQVRENHTLPNLSAAVGVAKMLRRGKVVVAIAEDFESDEDALRYAAQAKLPLIGVITGAPQEERAWPDYESHGFPTIHVEATDAVALFRVLQEGMLHARLGAGPTLIGCHRILRQSPLAHMKKYLESKQLSE